MFETLQIVSKFFGISDKKIRAFFGKILSEFSQMPSARPQESFAENQFFTKEAMFLVWKLDLQQFFLSRGK